MKFAYADPPYLGQARKHYGPEAREVNHPLLIAHLQEFDGWALSLSAPSLRTILPMCPDDVRVCAWVKPFAGLEPDDDFTDLFPGSGAVTDAWETWRQQLRLTA